MKGIGRDLLVIVGGLTCVAGLVWSLVLGNDLNPVELVAIGAVLVAFGALRADG